jgi:O-acetyl-ADP-ribose deacetylase (regulator of RNase III)
MPEAVSPCTQVNRSVVQIIKGDITELEVDAFVYYAQPDLALGTGTGTAISVRGGPTIQKELDELGPVQTGEAVISSAGKLKAKYIIHAVGPRFQEENAESKLRTTVRNALKRAEEKGIRRIAFPAMGAGYYGIAPDLCARVMLEVIRGHLETVADFEEVTICVLDTRQFESFRVRLTALS